jgi:hypothetical protein
VGVCWGFTLLVLSSVGPARLNVNSTDPACPLLRARVGAVFHSCFALCQMETEHFFTVHYLTSIMVHAGNIQARVQDPPDHLVENARHDSGPHVPYIEWCLSFRLKTAVLLSDVKESMGSWPVLGVKGSLAWLPFL